MLNLPAVWSDGCLAHEPDAEIWVGVRMPSTELPRRATVIRDAVVAAGARLVPAQPHDDEAPELVHDKEFLDYLANIYPAWEVAGFPTAPGQHRVVPYLLPTAAMLAGMPARIPKAIHARAGCAERTVEYGAVPGCLHLSNLFTGDGCEHHGSRSDRFGGGLGLCSAGLYNARDDSPRSRPWPHGYRMAVM